MRARVVLLLWLLLLVSVASFNGVSSEQTAVVEERREKDDDVSSTTTPASTPKGVVHEGSKRVKEKHVTPAAAILVGHADPSGGEKLGKQRGKHQQPRHQQPRQKQASSTSNVIVQRDGSKQQRAQLIGQLSDTIPSADVQRQKHAEMLQRQQQQQHPQQPPEEDELLEESSSFLYSAVVWVSLLAVILLASVLLRRYLQTRHNNNNNNSSSRRNPGGSMWDAAIVPVISGFVKRAVVQAAGVVRVLVVNGWGLARQMATKIRISNNSNNNSNNNNNSNQTMLNNKKDYSADEDVEENRLLLPSASHDTSSTSMQEQKRKRKTNKEDLSSSTTTTTSITTSISSSSSSQRKQVVNNSMPFPPEFDVQAPLISPDSSSSLPHTFDFPFPQMINESEPLLTNKSLLQVYASLPSVLRTSNLKLVYSMQQHGASFQTLLHLTDKHHQDGKEDVPFGNANLLLVQDSNKYIFGAFLTEEWTMGSKYYGTGESFVMQIRPSFHTYRASQRNSFFQIFTSDMLAVGGGDNFAIVLGEHFRSGGSGSCQTFNSPVLASEEEFGVNQVEVWQFTE